MVTLQEIIDAINAGATAEKIALAEKVEASAQFLENQRQAEAQATWDAGIAAATTWWNSTIQPTLLWNNTQTLEDQRTNILIDYNNVKLLLNTETDQYRIYLIKQKLKQAEDKFKQIKAALA